MPTADGQALLRNNRPLLAYIAGKPARFTSKDHNFQPGETVEKQLIVINNSRETVTCECDWSLELGPGAPGSADRKSVSVATGQQERIPLRFAIAPGGWAGDLLFESARTFSSGEIQEDSFAVHVLPGTPAPRVAGKIALFDPAGETGELLSSLGVDCQRIDAGTDLDGYDILVVGKRALNSGGAAPSFERVPGGLKVIVFEQTADALEKRLGFRVQEYGLRQVFPRVVDHPVLSGIGTENLRDWRGAATVLSPSCVMSCVPVTARRSFGVASGCRTSGGAATTETSHRY